MARQCANQGISFSYLFENSYFIFVKESSHVDFMLSMIFFFFLQTDLFQKKEQFNP